MTSLLIRELPRSIEAHKDADPAGTWVTGSAIVQAELVQSLLRYGRFERYYFLWPAAGSPEQARSRLSEYAHGDRASLIGVADLAAMASRQRLVLLTGSSFVERLVPLRRTRSRTNWPLTGFTHALSYRECLSQCLLMLLGELYEYDSLICTSLAGKRAIQNVFDQVAAYLARRVGRTLTFRGQLPVIPLGTDAASVPQPDRRACRIRTGLSHDAVVFLCLGRFSAGDKADLLPLILHFAELARARTDVVLVLAGDDTQHALAPTLQALARSLGVFDQVIVRPNVTRREKASLYGAADVFVAVSDSVQETFGLTLVEAMAHGLPVIASDWSGYRESVEHGRTGFLVPTYWDASTVDPVTCALGGEGVAHWLLGQSVCMDWRSLRQYLALLRDDPDLRRRLGDNARQRVLERYDWPIVIRQYEDLWEEQSKAAAARMDSSPDDGDGLHRFDRRSIFSHYATETAGDVTMLRLSDLGRRLAAGEPPLATATGGAAILDGPLGRAMAAIAGHAALNEDNATIEMRTLSSHLRTDLTVSTEEISRSIVRLVKYGVLERVSMETAPIDEPPPMVPGTVNRAVRANARERS